MASHRRLSTVAGLALALVIASPAAAWSGPNAVSYANAYWHDYNSGWTRYAEDCANFVSQAVFAGGYPMHTSGNNPWYGNYGYLHEYSQSWRLVQYNRGFFLTDIPGGWVNYVYYGIKWAYPTTVYLGDIIYYAWQNDRTFATNSHEAIVTALNSRATSTADTGVLVNAHTTDHYREFWTLYPWNADWWRTYYEILHISSTN